MAGDTPKAKQKSRSPKKSGGLLGMARSGDIFFFIVAFIVLIVVLQFESDRLVDMIINRYAGLILIIMIVEYLVLKSFDRTRVYERENERYKNAHRQYRKALSRANELLTEATENRYEEASEEDVKWRTLAEDNVQEIESLLQSRVN